jgi:transcriptional regulator with XRE-family HTH domain
MAPRAAAQHPLCMARRTSKEPIFRPNFIKAWREFRGLTQEKLAARVEDIGGQAISAGMISRLENRQVAYTQQRLEALADALGCDPADLLRRPPGAATGIEDALQPLPPEEQRRAVEILKAAFPRLRTGTDG